MAGKSKRDIIKLVSTAGTGYYYTTAKNKRNNPDKLEKKMYDPIIRKHVIFKEAKIKWAPNAYKTGKLDFTF